MANYTIVRNCGHEAQMKVRGVMPTRERELDRERQRTCLCCAIENQRSEAKELPALMGTLKQIAWVMTLRHKALVDAEMHLDYLRVSGQSKGKVGKDMDSSRRRRKGYSIRSKPGRRLLGGSTGVASLLGSS